MQNHPFPAAPLKFLALYARRHILLFGGIVICMVGAGALTKLEPYFFSKLVALFTTETEFLTIKSVFLFYLWLMIVALLGKELLDIGYTWLTEVRFQCLVRKEISLELFDYLAGHSVGYFADNMAGALAQRCTSLATSASGFYISLLYYVYNFVCLLFTYVLLVRVNWKLGLLFLLAVLCIACVLLRLGKFSMNLRQEMTEARNRVAGNMIDALQNSFFVRIFNGKRHEIERGTAFLDAENNTVNKSCLVEHSQSTGEFLFLKMMSMLLFFYSIWLWKKEEISGADVVLVFLLVWDVARQVSAIVQRTIIYSGELAEMRRNLIVFSTPHEVNDKENASKLKIKDGKIEVKNITFAYKNNNPIFKNFSLTIEPRQKVGVVGVSGSGKSTLVNLLLRLYDVQKGQILIDGKDIADVTQDSLHQAVGYVPQSGQVMECSVAENIAYARPGVSLAQIKKAAVRAYADLFIKKLPDGYNTILNADNKLSGGQLARITIARAFLKNSPVLILDEATAALDSESETFIQQALEDIIKDKTVLVVAHRLSTLRHMDRIIVLEKGKIIEDGSFESLIQRDGRFAEFWRLQQMKEETHDKQ